MRIIIIYGEDRKKERKNNESPFGFIRARYNTAINNNPSRMVLFFFFFSLFFF